MKLHKNFYFVLSLAVAALVSCDDVIDLKLNEAEPILVVDAWINNKPEAQEIRISRTQNYYSRDINNIAVDEVYIMGSPSGERYDFVRSSSDGVYRWLPTASRPQFGSMENTYTLIVKEGETTFTSQSKLNRTTDIDTLIFEFREENSFLEDSYWVDFSASDPEGFDDTYWIKTFKNGEYLNEPDEINVAYDAAFTPGGGIDGAPFIQPLRDATNRFENNEETDKFMSPYNINDTVRVEIHSINNDAFFFFVELQGQIDRDGGFGELFATPLANQKTNITGINSANQEIRALGFFNVSAVSIYEEVLTEEKAAESRKNPI